MPFVVEIANIDDLPTLMETFIACTSEMRKNNILQWDYTYPTPGLVLDDIEDENVFIIKRNNRSLGTIALNENQNKQYQNVNWKYNEGKILVIHRLSVHPLVQGEGIGKQLSLFAEDYARKNGYNAIRLDAYSKNPISNRMYQKLGYEKADGSCYFHGNPEPFNCYEKRIL